MLQSQKLYDGLRLYFGKLGQFTHNARMVLVYSAMTGMVFGVFRLLFNFYVLSLGGYDERFLGALTSASSVAALLMALPAAYIAERFSQKNIMIVTGWLSAFALLGFVLLPYRFFLVLFNLVSGLTQSTRQVAMSPFLMSNTSEEERQYVFSFNFGLVMLSGFVGNMFGGLLPAWLGGLVDVASTDTLAYQLTLSVMILVSLLAIGPLTRIHKLPPDPGRTIELPWVQLSQHSRLLIKAITPNLIIGLGAGMMMPFMNLYYRNVFHRPDRVIGTLFMFDAIAMSISQFIAPPLADRLGKINTVVLTQVLSVPFLLTLGLAAWVVPRGNANVTLWFFIAAIAYLFRVALMNLGGPVYQTFILEQVEPNVQALATSLNSLSFQFGWVFSPYLSGWFQVEYGEFGFVPVFLTTSALYIVGITVTWIFFRDAAKRPTQLKRVQPATSSR